MKLILHWFLSAIGLLLTAFLVPGAAISGLITALILAVVIGSINAVVRPLLVALTLPLTVVTFGLFLLIINGITVFLASMIMPGFTVNGFWTAVLFAIILSIVNGVIHSFEGASAPAL